MCEQSTYLFQFPEWTHINVLLYISNHLGAYNISACVSRLLAHTVSIYTNKLTCYKYM